MYLYVRVCVYVYGQKETLYHEMSLDNNYLDHLPLLSPFPLCLWGIAFFLDQMTHNVPFRIIAEI